MNICKFYKYSDNRKNTHAQMKESEIGPTPTLYNTKRFFDKMSDAKYLQNVKEDVIMFQSKKMV